MNILHLLGGTVCHQFPPRTLGCDGALMALCARCTGVYTGIFMLLLYLALRQQLATRRFAPPATYALALLALGGSGIDILLAKHLSLYPSQPWLRVLTGLWSGIGLTVLCLPIFNSQLVLPRTEESASPLTPRALLGLLLVAPLFMALLLLLGQSPAGILLASAVTVSVMTGALIYIITVIVHALATTIRPALPRWPALLLGVVLYGLLVYFVHAVHGA